MTMGNASVSSSIEDPS